MRIQHNIAALNSHRQLTNNNTAVAKNLEKLSSGYKINRAGDDAAGLAISEKMRAQITGLDTASRNAQDGISLVQTAEGALTEVHSMLNRMAELADQSANGTYQDSVDRENIQKELNSLRSEVDRISAGTNFNGIKLLDGSLSEKGAAGGSTSATVTFVGPKGIRPDDVVAIAGEYELNVALDTTLAKAGDKVSYTFNYTDNAGTIQSKQIDLTLSKSAADNAVYVLTDADGNEYKLDDPTTAAAETKDLHRTVMEALKNDETFSANFKVTPKTGALTTNFTFTAVNKGVSGAKLTGMGIVTTTAAGVVTTVDKAPRMLMVNLPPERLLQIFPSP